MTGPHRIVPWNEYWRVEEYDGYKNKWTVVLTYLSKEDAEEGLRNFLKPYPPEYDYLGRKD